MENTRINVTKSAMPSYEEYIDEIKPLWESRWLSNRGAISKKFENELKDYLKCSDLYLFANGHVALEVCIDTLGLHEGEVITTAYTHVSTTHSIVRNGLTPVFVDIKEDDLTIDPECIEKAITKRTVAIVATHVYGFACDVERIEEIANRYGLYVIYDAAHAFGVEKNGVGIANYGDAVMFSTHATKVFQTIEGGVLVYKDKQKFETIGSRVNFGYVGQEEVAYVSTNARMNEFEAAMGVCNLRHIDEEILKRKQVGDKYYERLAGIYGIKLIEPKPDLKWNYAYFPVFFENYKYNRDEIKALLEEENVFARKYFYPLTNKVKAYNEKYGNISLPHSEKAANSVLALPMYGDLAIEDVDRICDIIIRS